MLFWSFLLKRIKRWQVYRETLAELNGLDDRTLADINIRRGDIDFIARESAKAAA